MASGRVPKTSIIVFIMRVFGLLLLLGFPLNLYRPISSAKRRQAKGRARGHRPNSSRTSSARPFSLRSATTALLGSKRSTALMKLEPMLPAPPMTQTFLPLISWVSFCLFASMSGANMLTGRKVTLEEMYLERLNI